MSEKQSHVEFAKTLMEVTTFRNLGYQMVLEQFKDCIPPEIAAHIAEHGVRTASEAAILADEYVLAHKIKFGKIRTLDNALNQC